eukprot:gene3721-4642_t
MQAEFSISKLRLKVAMRHTIRAEERLINFSLERNRPNPVLRSAEGFWFVESPADRTDGYTRVWFHAAVIASPLLPASLVDYAAGKALAKATNWIQPYFSSN